MLQEETGQTDSRSELY